MKLAMLLLEYSSAEKELHTQHLLNNPEKKGCRGPSQNLVLVKLLNVNFEYK